jgi:hypothetical protein
MVSFLLPVVLANNHVKHRERHDHSHHISQLNHLADQTQEGPLCAYLWQRPSCSPLVFLVLGILEGDGCVGLSLLCLEAPEDEEAVVSEFTMHLELLMDLFLWSIITFSLPLLFGCLSSFSESWLMVSYLWCLPGLDLWLPALVGQRLHMCTQQ